MFDVGGTEILLILIIALLVMGPKHLPKIARTIGQVTAQVRRMTNEFKSAIDDEVRALELEEIRKEREKTGAEKTSASAPTAPSASAGPAYDENAAGPAPDEKGGSK